MKWYFAEVGQKEYFDLIFGALNPSDIFDKLDTVKNVIFQESHFGGLTAIQCNFDNDSDFESLDDKDANEECCVGVLDRVISTSFNVNFMVIKGLAKTRAGGEEIIYWLLFKPSELTPEEIERYIH